MNPIRGCKVKSIFYFLNISIQKELLTLWIIDIVLSLCTFDRSLNNYSFINLTKFELSNSFYTFCYYTHDLLLAYTIYSNSLAADLWTLLLWSLTTLIRMLVFKFNSSKLWISICHYVLLIYTWLLVLRYLYKCWMEERFRFQHEKKQVIMTLEEQQVLRRKARGLPSYTYSVPLALVDSDEEDEIEAFESTDLIDEKIQSKHSNGYLEDNLDENFEISKSLSLEKAYTSTNDYIVDQFVQIILFIVQYNEKFEPCLEPMNQDNFKCTFLHPYLEGDCASDHSFFIHNTFHNSNQFRKGNILKYEEDYPGIFHKANRNAMSSQSLRTIRDMFE